jgi:hypothetical protein
MTKTIFALLLVVLALSQTRAVVGAAHVFQPYAAVSITPINHVLRGGEAAATPVSKKNHQKPTKQQPQPPKRGSTTPTSSSKALVKSSATARSPLVTLQQVEVLQRSLVAAISCITTWAMATQQPGGIKLNPIQAAGLQGLLACAVAAVVPRILPSLVVVVLGVPFCAASFCGAVAGMSAQISSLGDASLLGCLTSVAYYIFERPDHKLQLGKGGRLGTIAFLANVVYFAIRNGHEKVPTLITDIVDRLQPSTTAAVVVAAIVLNLARRSSSRVVQQQKAQTNTISLAITASKGVIIAALLDRLLQSSDVKTIGFALTKSTLAMMAASWAVQKSKPFVILPVATLGLMGATFFDMSSIAAPIFLGAFLGMTSLPPFNYMTSSSSSQGAVKFLQASVLSAILLQLGLIAGFGGRLGVLAFVGVNFAL